MKIQLEATGGFTGRAGTQTIQVDTDRLAPADAARLTRGLEQLPDTVWGQSFPNPHPQSWDFLYELTVTDAGAAPKTVRFHRGQGPPALTQLVDTLNDLHSPGR